MRDFDLTGQHRLDHPRAAADANNLHIQTVLFENPGFLGDERNSLRAVGFEMDKAELCEPLLSIHRGSKTKHSKYENCEH